MATTTITVSTAAELSGALARATGGETILLAGGGYGALSLSGRTFGSTVTIRSADPGNRATFDSVMIDGSRNIRIDGVHVDNPSNGDFVTKVVAVTGSTDIAVVNSEINGKVDSEYQGHYGLYTSGSNRITFAGNYVHDVKNGAVLEGSSAIELSGTRFDYLGNDAIKFSGIDGLLLENNTGASHIYPAEGAHVDFIQGQGSASSNIVVRGNVAIQGPDSWSFQGIFFDDTTFNNVLIENNIIVNGHLRGITISAGSDIIVRNNTVLTHADSGHKASIILMPAGSLIQNNIDSGDTSIAGAWGNNNLRLQWNNPSAPFYYDNVYVNATAGRGLTLADLAPVPGSVGETMGAYARLAELLGTSDTGTKAGDDTLAAVEDTALTFSAADLLANDSDRDGDPLSIMSIGQPSSGTLRDNGDGTYTYTPAADFWGTDGFDYMVADGKGGQDIGTVTVTVRGVNDAPIARNDGATLLQDTPSTLYLLANDSDPDGDELTIVSTSAAAHGAISIGTGGLVVYTPNSGFVGADSFSYTITDGRLTSTAQVTLNVLDASNILNRVIFAGEESYSFSGNAADVIEIAHVDAFDVPAATIAFTFNADSVAGMHGLLSKDATGYGSGGHFTSFIQDGTLTVRVQSATGEKVFTMPGIETGRTYDLQVSFGDGRTAVWLDGTLVGSADFEMSWDNNTEFLQIGANGWASAAGKPGFVGVFSGQIGQLVIARGTMTPSEIATLRTALLEDDNDVAYIAGSAFSDTIYGTTGTDDIRGFGQGDLLYGGDAGDSLYGGEGQDVLFGNTGNDRLNGGEGFDRLFGGPGDDILIGGNGGDWLSGGTGADRFIISAGHAGSRPEDRDLIRDFSSAEGDRIDLTGIDGDVTRDGWQALSWIGSGTEFTAAGQVRWSINVGRLLINLDDDADAEMVIEVAGVSLLTAGDLLL